MKKEILGYVGIGVVVLLVLIGIVGSMGIGIVVERETQSSSGDVIVDEDLELGQYRTEDIPVDCRLPEYESSIKSWKEHLSHHGNTLYCLEYFE